ncbi:MAG: hypothetical protein WCK86_08325 [Planctomycetia bacterium]
MKNSDQPLFCKAFTVTAVRQITSVRPLLYGLAAVLICLQLPGCDSVNGTGDQDMELSMESEHSAPAHKPADFESLVAELERRFTELSMSSVQRDGDGRGLQTTELQDIVKWIPELAASSELQRKEFEKAVLCSQMLIQILDSNQVRQSGENRDWKKPVGELRALVPESKDAG